MQDTPQSLIYHLFSIYHDLSLTRNIPNQNKHCNCFDQDVDNGTGVSAAYNFSVGSSKWILSQSNNLRLFVKLDQLSGSNIIKFYYHTLAGKNLRTVIGFIPLLQNN